MSEYEYCCLCDDPTGRAGRADDSIFRELEHNIPTLQMNKGDELGPLCSKCNEFTEEQGWVTK